jgi:hypothetical protein
MRFKSKFVKQRILSLCLVIGQRHIPFRSGRLCESREGGCRTLFHID